MKKKKLAILSLLMSIAICSVGYAQEIESTQTPSVEVIDLGNSLMGELENPKTGETEEISLADCKKAVQTLAVDSLNDVVYRKDTIEGTSNIPINSLEDNSNVYTPMGGSSDYVTMIHTL